jgi:hypothetical protein
VHCLQRIHKTGSDGTKHTRCLGHVAGRCWPLLAVAGRCWPLLRAKAGIGPMAGRRRALCRRGGWMTALKATRPTLRSVGAFLVGRYPLLARVVCCWYILGFRVCCWHAFFAVGTYVGTYSTKVCWHAFFAVGTYRFWHIFTCYYLTETWNTAEISPAVIPIPSISAEHE